MARVIEHASRSIGDAQRVDVRLNYLGDLLTQADYFARQAGAALVLPSHVQQAIDAAEQRSGRVRERVQEAILRDTLLIDTAGERVGQINGLAVLGLGGVMFGRPTPHHRPRAAGPGHACSTSSARWNWAARCTPRAC